jgi:valyl-tRNA synthetase
MSKLRGNVINPADAIGKYGVDALRFALTTGTSPGNDTIWAKVNWNPAAICQQVVECHQIYPSEPGL